MSKIWNVSVVKSFDARETGQHYVAIDDLGTYGTRAAAEGAAKKFLKNETFEKIHDSEETVIFKFGKQELHLESIYIAE